MNFQPKFMFIFVLVSFVIICQNSEAFTNVYPKLKSFPLSKKDAKDAGNPLFLTPLIEKGNIQDARKQATVQHEEMKDVNSYAGYLTVNKQFNSNMFFWFFPAQVNPKQAPVVLWLQGGPGASSLFGLFTENGPFFVSSNKTLQLRKYSWSAHHNLIYIDNPVGTGYSFTENDAGYATNETQVGLDLHTALIQFFQLFPELQKNNFFVTGESYAGKYVPALSLTIHQLNPTAKIKINLKGLAMGNGLTDPVNQLLYGDYLYQLGLIDFNGRTQFHTMEKQGKDLINGHKYDEAFEVFNKLIDEDLNASPSLFKNLTGFNFYFNYLHTDDNQDMNSMAEWIQRVDVRRAIHVGNCSFDVEAQKVETFLKNDITRSQASAVVELLKHYKVLVYNGQLDIIVAYPLTENYLYNLTWSGAEQYRKTPRKQWHVEGALAGYSKTVENLTEVLVRNAGHMVPSDQPQWALDLITRFTYGKTF
ncbi:venom serine carboxypeptidase [Venturia canescens]|uniref:venom serine carboxypeptidase n=1 Tax=Venturia canescens TaxID=32260 RepID=UPI001C9CF6E5|nr:venom serine carboxypeptidase [Venturia canescens]